MKIDLFDLEIHGKSFIVTGASGDIGSAIAENLKKFGGVVHGSDIRSPANRSSFDSFEIVDVTNAGSVRSYIKPLLTPELDTVILCAGITGEITDAESQSDEVFQATINSSIIGSSLFVKNVVGHFKSLRRGQFVLFSSTAGFRGTALMPAYTAAKHGIIGLTRSYARELGPFGIRVNAICPGLTAGTMALHIHKKLSERVKSKDAVINTVVNSEERFASLPESSLQQIPLRRAATPNDIAMAILFFSSPMGRYANGCILNLDGGLLSK